MNFVDYILIAVMGLLLAAAGYAIHRSKKSGKKCIGCPDAGACSGNCNCCSCGCNK